MKIESQALHTINRHLLADPNTPAEVADAMEKLLRIYEARHRDRAPLLTKVNQRATAQTERKSG